MRNRSGVSAFSLIEIIVVIAIVAIVLPLLFSSTFAVMQQQRSILRATEVKSEGDAVVDYLERTLRAQTTDLYASDGTAVCAVGQPYGTTKSVASFATSVNGVSSTVHLVISNGRLCLNTVGVNDCTSASAHPLTSRQVVASGLLMQCSRSSASSLPLVQVQYTIQYAAIGATRIEDTARMDFLTSAKLMNIQ